METADYQCGYCGEYNTTFVDLSAGFSQSYVEDCQVCCRPNLLSCCVDRESLAVQITAEYNG
ncbi:MAG: CPXCG motif-containing cysteine-rich protein [Acaryochloridaceae cyanobacterium SU_2_1]|nr:CPXCG motif-containing cysteine-rich protein [Acaryochloridaceae cyanobacterium SU_2_1]